MAYLATNRDGKTYVFAGLPIRYGYVKIQVPKEFWEDCEDDLIRDEVEYMVVENQEAFRWDKYKQRLAFKEIPLQHSLDNYIEWGVPRENFDAQWYVEYEQGIEISRESAIKLVGKELTFFDDPVQI